MVAAVPAVLANDITVVSQSGRGSSLIRRKREVSSARKGSSTGGAFCGVGYARGGSGSFFFGPFVTSPSSVRTRCSIASNSSGFSFSSRLTF